MRRTTIVLLVLFVLLGALFWFMQQPGNPIKTAMATSTTLPAASQETLISPDKGPVSALSIQDAAGKTILISKKAGQWTVNDGQEKPADQSQAESAAGHVLNLTIVKKFETAPDPAGTGLDKPSFTISATMADGSIFTFMTGKATVTGSGYYAKAPGEIVLILSKSEIEALTHYLAQPPLLATATVPAPLASTPPAGMPPPAGVPSSSTDATPTSRP